MPSTSGRPAVFTQERPKVFPCPAFAPGVPQGPAPSASGLEVCGRGRVDDHTDGVAAALLAKLKQLGNAPSRRFCLIPSPQLDIELEHGSEIVVEREPASCSKALPLQVPQSSIVFRSCLSDINGISCRKAPQYRWAKKRSPEFTRELSRGGSKHGRLSVSKLAVSEGRHGYRTARGRSGAI